MMDLIISLIINKAVLIGVEIVISFFKLLLS